MSKFDEYCRNYRFVKLEWREGILQMSVHPPTGKVRIAAPLRMNADTIRVFAISKLGWIKKQQQKLRKQERETPREYLDRESRYCWGKRYLLKMVENDALLESNSSTPACSCTCAQALMTTRSNPSWMNGFAGSSRLRSHR